MAVKANVRVRRAETIDDYLAFLRADKRGALEKLRQDIRAAAPRAEECISYQIPAFRLDGRMLVWFGAGAEHCAFYPGAIVEAFKRDLKRYDTRKGTIRFPPSHPLPSALVRRIVKAAITRNSARARQKSGRR